MDPQSPGRTQDAPSKRARAIWRLLLGTTASSTKSAEELRRYQLCAALAVIMTVIVAMLVVIRVFAGMYALASRGALALPVCVATLVLLRRGHPRAAAHVICGGMILIAASTNLMSFGQVPAAFLCSAGLVVITILLLGGRAGGLWGVVLGLSMIAATVLRQSDLTPLLAVPLAYREVQWYLAGVITCFVSLVASLLYERLHAQTLRDLSLAKDSAEAANRAKSAFLATMSHEIRTPLNGVFGIAQLLAGRDLDAESKRLTSTLLESSESLLKVINSILDMSKIEAGAMELERTGFDLHQLCVDVVDLMACAVDTDEVDVVLAYDGPTPCPVIGDPTRLRQVMTNLLNNGTKFTAQGSVTLKVVASATDSDTIRIAVAVEDTGIGISAEALPGLFDHYSQAEASTTRQYGGTGLGLAISHHLVALMGGELGARSDVGRGACFYFALELEVGRASTTMSPTSLIADIRFDGRVLVVDDNPVNRLIIKKMLSSMGIDIVIATDGLEAVGAAREGRYDCVLMDCQMPNMDGYEATRCIRELPGHEQTVIIALTANAFAEDRRRCLDAGMNDFLAKPIKKELLAAALAHWLPEHVASPATAHASVEVVTRP